jgi:hypothetical protein
LWTLASTGGACVVVVRTLMISDTLARAEHVSASATVHTPTAEQHAERSDDILLLPLMTLAGLHQSS